VDWNDMQGSNTFGDDKVVAFFIRNVVGGCGKPVRHLVPGSPTCGAYANPEENEVLFYSFW